MRLQDLWLQSGGIFLVAAAVAVAVALIRRRAAAPLVALGLAFLVSRAIGFLLAYFVSSESAAPVVQVVTQYVRIAPSVLLLIYACLVAARRYRAARSHDLLRVWLLRAPYVHGGAVLFNLAADLLLRPPLLSDGGGIPAASFYASVPNYVTAVLYAGTVSWVFIAAAKTAEGTLTVGQRVQNLFWGVAMTGLGLLTAFALIRNGIRTFAPQDRIDDLIESLGDFQIFFYAMYAGGVSIGIVAYYAQSRRDRFVDRFLGFLDLADDLIDEMANVPVHDGKLNRPYAIMLEAAGDDFLDLPARDMRKVDSTFRLKALWEGWAGGGAHGGRLGAVRRRMADLLAAYQYELKEPVLAKGLRTEHDEDEAAGGATLEALRDLFPTDRGPEGPGGLGEALSLVLRKDEGQAERIDLSRLAEWEQLAYVAMADAGLLSGRLRAAVLEQDGVLKRIIDAYDLARYKLSVHG